jgi:hypothetical protein
VKETEVERYRDDFLLRERHTATHAPASTP